MLKLVDHIERAASASRRRECFEQWPVPLRRHCAARRVELIGIAGIEHHLGRARRLEFSEARAQGRSVAPRADCIDQSMKREVSESFDHDHQLGAETISFLTPEKDAITVSFRK